MKIYIQCYIYIWHKNVPVEPATPWPRSKRLFVARRCDPLLLRPDAGLAFQLPDSLAHGFLSSLARSFRIPRAPAAAAPRLRDAWWRRRRALRQVYRRDDQDDRDDLQRRALPIPAAPRGSCLTDASVAGRPARNYSTMVAKTAYFSAGHKVPTSINTANHFRHLSLMIFSRIFVTINFRIFRIKLWRWRYV